MNAVRNSTTKSDAPEDQNACETASVDEPNADLSDRAHEALRRLARALGRAAAREYLASPDQANSSGADDERPASTSSNLEEA